ncbi:MAG: SH3 domain-containing protein [Treponema sp.]|nr:SH3 domain-containing protein [Treponema sp.]
MKKIICILFSFTVLLTSAFADKSRFYKNGKVIDTMYVDAEDGLRVRDYPSLSSDRICGLTYGFPVKVIAIGKEETIDGITAPWVEILLPRYEWENFEPEYGWVFGGYLSTERKTFSTKGWTEWNFKKYLSKCHWIEDSNADGRIILCFEEDGEFKLQVEERGAGAFGTWRTDFKNMSVITSSAFMYAGDDDYTPEEETVVYKIGNISEFSFTVNGKRYVPDCDWGVIYNEKNFKITDRDSSDFNRNLKYFLQALYSSENIFSSIYDRSSDLKNSYIKYGVYYSKNEDYMNSYHAYWDPIMREHQKKVDAMR